MKKIVNFIKKVIHRIFNIFRRKVSYGLNKFSDRILKKYPKIVLSLKKKITDNQKIRVCFLVVFDSVFPAEPLFKKMLQDDIFEPYILVIPDISRGSENMFMQLDKTYQSFCKKFDKKYIKNSYDFENKIFINDVWNTDIACFANPYDIMTKKVYSIKYYSKHKILPFYINYGSMLDYYSRDHVINLESLNLCWKIFVDTQNNIEEFVKYTARKGKNVVVSGYCKMDALNLIPKKQLEREKIIIAPHHTVNIPALPLSNFLEYSDFFLELPQKYPQIDFVFRPHPLLFVTLANDNLWGKEKVVQYIEKLSSFSNAEYQNGGDYFDTFVNSSALIHDCCSFAMEYLYTGKPACYMLKCKNEVEKLFIPIGQKCLANHYQVFSKEEIISFIENVVLNKNDFMQKGRIDFTQRELMINYPNVANWIYNYIKNEFM